VACHESKIDQTRRAGANLKNEKGRVENVAIKGKLTFAAGADSWVGGGAGAPGKNRRTEDLISTCLDPRGSRP